MSKNRQGDPAGKREKSASATEPVFFCMVIMGAVPFRNIVVVMMLRPKGRFIIARICRFVSDFQGKEREMNCFSEINHKNNLEYK